MGCLVIALLATAASAGWVPLTGAPNSLSSLEGGSLVFGDKEISEFDMFGFGGGGAVDPNTDEIFVQGGQNSVTGDYGLKFNFSWIAAPNQTVNATLSFKVSILPGFDDYLIKDVALAITGVSTNGTGVVSVGEEVWDVPFLTPGRYPIASLSCSKWKGSPLDYLVDYAEFAPVKEIWICSKDISISGGISGSAHISEFYQFYSQIPEPATITLLGLAGAIVLRRRRG